MKILLISRLQKLRANVTVFTNLQGGQPDMKCYACGGRMEKAHKDIEANWKGHTVVFRGLEAWFCKTCGEQAYEPDDARLIR